MFNIFKPKSKIVKKFCLADADIILHYLNQTNLYRGVTYKFLKDTLLLIDKHKRELKSCHSVVDLIGCYKTNDMFNSLTGKGYGHIFLSYIKEINSYIFICTLQGLKSSQDRKLFFFSETYDDLFNNLINVFFRNVFNFPPLVLNDRSISFVKEKYKIYISKDTEKLPNGIEKCNATGYHGIIITHKIDTQQCPLEYPVAGVY